ncbi:hypothetical protein EVAR_84927_1 [Eumeta japonica]|uniref:Uncharacterized protein n=1 Tax=Eumeta variegata TaxID=151549 RepID=A0A4C1VHI7_EUMVA|nr:hypothetical protein EVAR_84927_1 [Eumeta japonica]
MNCSALTRPPMVNDRTRGFRGLGNRYLNRSEKSIGLLLYDPSDSKARSALEPRKGTYDNKPVLIARDRHLLFTVTKTRRREITKVVTGEGRSSAESGLGQWPPIAPGARAQRPYVHDGRRRPAAARPRAAAIHRRSRLGSRAFRKHARRCSFMLF